MYRLLPPPFWALLVGSHGCPEGDFSRKPEHFGVAAISYLGR
jgi:hypothetical protein